ncbi:MAG TPA: M20/M25/M40 family metallo-hydrolase, partial [Bacteroidota bacterium]|nr:M20/M25/M40 family metallo-hydrolase [Bacteroidota bacterium]
IYFNSEIRQGISLYMSLRLRCSALVLLITLFCSSLFSQVKVENVRPYETIAKQIISKGLASGKAYELLHELTTKIGARLSGSPQAEKAVEWAKKTMEGFDFDNVRLEVVMVPRWVRGDVEECTVIYTSSIVTMPLTICALGGSINTPREGITAQVLEVQSFDQLKEMKAQAEGKIIFFNRPMDRSKINPGEAYGGAVNQRSQGAIEAATVGGVAALVRSMTMQIDDNPHTGAMHYNDTIPKVPTAAISTVAANTLSELLKKQKDLKVNLKLSCQTLPDVESANVIGELSGDEKPEEVILIGGHLDSWDKGQGAHDDGAGCVQAIEALRLMKELGLKPKRTIRAVMFMNEENGLQGAKAYASKKRPGEKHIAAIESDAGGFTPKGFGVQADSLIVDRIAKWSYLLEPIDADRIRRGGGGADIGELGRQGVPALGLRVDGQKYFDYHHSDNDTIDKVHERELQLGAIAMAILSYVLAEEGL